MYRPRREFLNEGVAVGIFEWRLLGGCFVDDVWEEAKYKNAF
jgi:hypothetical protein